MRQALLLGTVLLAATARAQTEYPLTPDSERQAGVPSGQLTKHTWDEHRLPGDAA